MTAGKSRCLVIDACVVQAAGKTEHPVSSACRNALQAVLEICHRVAWTNAIRDEWSLHMSRFSRKWLLSMWARRKVVRKNVSNSSSLKANDLTETERRALEKDAHLIEAAKAADRIIVTVEKELPRLFAKTGTSAKLTFINPVTDGVEAIRGL